MDSGSSCLCDSSDPTDPTEYLETLKKKYLERTAKLQAQQRELEQKIVKMESFIGKSKDPAKSLQQSCECDSSVVPRVFPETPVRDMPTIPKTITDVAQNQPTVSQQCSFFQKMMENAKNILSLKCQCPTPPNVTQGTTTETAITTTTSLTPPNTATATSQNTTTTGTTDPTYSEVPTKDNDRSEQQKVVDYDTTLTDKSSRTSTCSCDFSDPSTLQEASCSCHISALKASTTQKGQQVSIEHSSSTPKEQTDVDPLTSSVSKSDKCPWVNTMTSELMSEGCSCELCKCSSLIIDGKQLDKDNVPAETVPPKNVPAQDVVTDNVPQEKVPLPTVTVFMEKGDSPDAEVQVAATLESKGVHSELPKDTASKCVTCCRNSACPKNKVVTGKGDNLSAGVQAAASTTNKGVNFKQSATITNLGNDKPKDICRGRCNPQPPPKERRDDPTQDQQVQFKVSNQDVPNRQDGQNQCAFIGSPLLTFDAFGTTRSTSVTGPKSTNTATSSLKIPCNCNTPQGPKKICPVSNYSLNSADILEMQTVADLAKKEKEMKAQIANLQKREKQYQEATRNAETLATKTNSHCCCCCQKKTTGMDNDIEKIGRELRLENQILKSELEDLKMELKHCLEKIEGPMKRKLETEKQKCECLQKELQSASKNMAVNQDSYAREMNQLKLQLCCACNNITELNQMNTRLKDEMSQLDCLCQKLEDDLVKQKVSEAETIKRLTGRKYTGEAPRSQPSEDIRCESSLDVIARKLSKTLKELAPCDECSKLPNELAGAARCIKDLTDMVRKRKAKSLTTNTCSCQSRPPSKPPSKSFSEEDECCTCCGPRDGGGESARKPRSAEEKVVKTLHQVPDSFVQKDQSSKFDVHPTQSSYYSAQGEPVREVPCAHIGTPCFQSKATLAKEEPPKKEGIRPCSGIGEPCKTGSAQSSTRNKPVQVTPKEDKICKAPCSEILQPVKDQEVQEALDAEKEPGPQEKPVQVPEVPRQADKGCSASCEFMKKVKSKEGGEKIPSKTKSLEKAASGEKSALGERGDEPIAEEIGEAPLTEEKEIGVLAEAEPAPEGVEGEPEVDEKESKVEEKESRVEEKDSKVAEKESKVEEKGSKVEEKGSKVEGKGSTVEEKGSKVEGKGSKVEEKGSKVEGKGSIVEEKGSKVEGKRSSVEAKGSKVEEREIPDEIQSPVVEELLTAKHVEPIGTTKSTPTAADVGKKLSSTSSDKKHRETLGQVPEEVTESAPDTSQIMDETSSPKTEAISPDEPISGAKGDSSREGVKDLPSDDTEETTPLKQLPRDDADETVAVKGPPSVKMESVKASRGKLPPDTEYGMIAHPSKEMPVGHDYSVPMEDIKQEMLDTVPELSGESGAALDVSYDTEEGMEDYGEEARPDHKGGALSHDRVHIGDREIPVEETRFGGEFPYDVGTKAFVVDEPPSGLHISTTITGSGTLEVITEGPGGSIETTLVYTESGNIEVVTEMVEHPEDESSPTDPALEKFATKPSFKVPSIPSTTRPCTPGASCYTMAKESGYVICEPQNVCHEMDKSGRPLLKPIPVDSSAISGPEAETPYTPSSATAADELTSKLATDSSGIRPVLDQTPDLTSVHGQSSAGHHPGSGTGVQAVPTMSPIPSLEPRSEKSKVLSDGGKGSEGKAASRTDTTPSVEQATFLYDKSHSTEGRKGEAEEVGAKSSLPSGQDVTPDQVPSGAGDLVSSSAQSSHQQGAAQDNLMSEALTSTTGELKSGEVFTPDQVGSEPEMQGRLQELEAQIIEDADRVIPQKASKLYDVEAAPMATDTSGLVVKGTASGQPVTFAELEMGEPPSISGIASYTSGQAGISSPTSAGSKYDDQITALRVKKSLYEEESKIGDTETFDVTGPDDKIVLEKAGDSKAPATGSFGPRATRDCSCQSKDQTNQSCQCCECKTIGVTTSGEKETTTQKDEDMGKAPHEEIEGTKTDTDTEFVSVSEVSDHAVAQRTSSKKAGDTLDDASSMPLSPSSRKQTGSKLDDLIDEETLEKQPGSREKTSSEQQKISTEIGDFGDYKTQESTGDDISVTEEMLAKYPELVGKTKSEQQRMLKELGYKRSHKIIVDEEMLQKHPELVGKTSEEQQAILRGLGYAVSKPEVTKMPRDHSSKDFEEQQVLSNIIYRTPSGSKIRVTEDLLLKHPELADKDSKEQQKILESLGYPTVDTEAGDVKTHPKPSVTLHEQVSAPGSTKESKIKIDPQLLEKHPELVGKSSEEQRKILQSLGYAVSEKVSAPPGESRSVIKSKGKIDPELLKKHPELIGKDSNEQRKILSDLGYTDTELVTKIKPEILASHPELAGKTLEEQKELLQQMGYIIDEVLELAVARVVSIQLSGGETFSTPLPSSKDVSVSCKAPCRSAAVPEDIPIEPGDAAESDDSFKMSSGADASADIRQKSSGKVPVDFLKKPSGASVPSDIPKKPSEKTAVLDITSSKAITRSRGSASGISKQPSSKEVSVTCRAPCKSAATLHVTPLKQSEKSICATGTVSSTTFSKSKSISLQQTPSSRDDSASCKASCRTMSVQSSGSRLAQSRREVREILTSRTESSTTASSSDARSKEKAKKRDTAKKGPGEVPSIVSELSDKERPAIESTKKPKSARKKRMRPYDCMKCDCDDPCNCSVCAPGRHKRETLKRPVRSCECPPNMMMIPPMVVVPPMQMTYSMPPTGHAANCRCNACLNQQVLSPRADMQRRPQAEFVTSDENEGGPKKHQPNCECVDCLCLPKIKKIANTKEHPVVFDQKQVYQVKVKCDTCTNAQNARRYLEQQQQSRSRIPISTTSANPPRVRSDPKQVEGSSDDQPAPAEETKQDEPQKGDDQKAAAPPLSASESVYNSVSCDCPDCVCSECPDEKKRPPPKVEVVPKESEKGATPVVTPTTPSVAHAPQGDKDCCCKEKPCVCEPCTVEELTKKLKEAEEKLAAAKSQMAAQPSAIEKEAPPEQEEECNCEICSCPRSDLVPSKQGKPPAGIPSATKSPAGEPGGQPPSGDDEPCNCVECVCPGADKMTPAKVPSATPPVAKSASQPKSSGDDAHPDDCTCPECTCPGISDFKAGVPKQPSAAKQPSAVKQPSVTKPPAAGAGDDECDCKECVCPGKDLLPGKSRAGDTAPTDIPLEACDCSDCRCSPCADPQKQAQKPRPEEPLGIADCDCIDCQCTPCADPKKRKDTPKEPKMDQPKKGPELEECDCSTCQCPGQAPPTTASTSTSPIAPTAPSAQEAPKETAETTHGDECDCPECTCPHSPSKIKAGVPPKESVPAKESKFTDMPEKVPHPEDCDCDECLCLEEILKKEVVAQTEKGVQPQAEKEIHSANCVCPECLCPECSTKATHAPGCMCGECVCSPCDKIEPAKTATAATPSVHATPGQAGDQKYHPTDCTCIKCVCDACTDPSKNTVAVDDQPHADGCKCIQCLCKECQMKSAPVRHHEGCQCPQCICTECPKMKQGDKPSQAAGEQPQAAPPVEQPQEAAPAAQPEEAAAASAGDQPQAAKSVSRQPAEAPSSAGDKEGNCICENCICIDCKGKGRGDKQGEGVCTCPVCECVVCDKKPPAAKPPQEGEGEQQKQRSENCKCVTCICNPCIKNIEEVCKCPDCQCLVCDKKPLDSDKKPAESDKKPVDSDEKPAEPAAPPQEGAGEQKHVSENCKCATCACDPCEKNPEEPCKCPECQCLECDKMREPSAAKPGDQATHSPACICSDCRCKPCFNMEKAEETCSCPVCTCVICSKKMDGKTPQPVEQQQAPPPTTQQETIGDQCIPEGDDCTCKVCICLECSRKRPRAGDQEMGEKETHSPVCECSVCQCKDDFGHGEAKPPKAAGEGLDFTNPPPFEPLQRVDCDCNQCGCVICNMRSKTEEATQEGAPSVKKASEHGATAPPSTVQVRSVQAASEQQKLELPDDNQPPPFEAPIRIDCICNRCSCVYCNKEAPQRSVAAQPSIVSSAIQRAVSVQPSLTAPGQGQTVAVQPSLTAPAQDQRSELQTTTGATPSHDATTTQSECPVMEAASQVAAVIIASQQDPSAIPLAPPTAESQLIYQIAASRQAAQAGPSQMQATATSQMATSAGMSQQIGASQMLYQTAISQHATQAAVSQQIPPVASQQAAAVAASQQAAAVAASQQAAAVAASQQAAASGYAPLPGQSQLCAEIAAQAAGSRTAPLPGQSQICAEIAASQMIATTAPSQPIVDSTRSKIVTAAAPSKLRFQIPISDITVGAASQQDADIAASQQAAAIAASQQAAAIAASQQAAAIAASQQAAAIAASQQIPGGATSQMITPSAPSNLIYQAAQSQQIAPVVASEIIPPVASSQQAGVVGSGPVTSIAPSQQVATIVANQMVAPGDPSQHETICPSKICSQIPANVFASLIAAGQQGVPTSQIVAQLASGQQVVPVGASQMIAPAVVGSQRAAQQGASQMATPAGASQVITPVMVASQRVPQLGASQIIPPGGASQIVAPVASGQQGVPGVPCDFCLKVAASLHAFQESQQAYKASQQAAAIGASQQVTPTVGSQMVTSAAASQQAAPTVGSQMVTSAAASQQAAPTVGSQMVTPAAASQQAAPIVGSQMVTSAAVSQQAAALAASQHSAGGTGHPQNCTCSKCLCSPCQLGGSGQPAGCTCNICSCGPCTFGAKTQSFLSGKDSKPVDIIKPPDLSNIDGIPIHCNCPTCTCDEGVIQTTTFDKTSPPTTAVVSGLSTAPYNSTTATSRTTGPVVSGVSTAPGATGEVYQSADTLVLPKPDVHKMYPPHPPECDCKQCLCMPCKDPNMAQSGVPITGAGSHADQKKSDLPLAEASVKAMDDVTLVRSIQAANQESGAYKGQIDEIKKTLDKIKCACTEAEFRSTQSMGQTMSKDMSPISAKPFVKQASAFGQTMSGLKMALNNLQAKCKAKDRMIEAMTTELQQRGTSEVFTKVMDMTGNMPSPLDYDTADDVKSLERSQIATNVIHAPPEVKDEGTTPSALKVTASKGVEVRTHKHKKRKEKQSDKDPDCACSKHQLIQKEEKDCQKLDLAGFEVVDIRRITDDSLIVKWNAPKNDQVQGYDIFVNGTLASKVMSGTRTSAMMHSLDLSKSVQITIYAVTGCGRVEPPAIAIYEIKS